MLTLNPSHSRKFLAEKLSTHKMPQIDCLCFRRKIRKNLNDQKLFLNFFFAFLFLFKYFVALNTIR
jgi:hypothetical protein